ncbi:MAG: hypothetical protein IPK19_05805 [Chloroflexi bacterium]|nr:hypothetical protein [Chloroflexota bacterium]
MNCRIHIQGRLSEDWFAGLTIVPGENGSTVIQGTLPDQTALFGVLRRIEQLNLRLIALHCAAFDSIASL